MTTCNKFNENLDGFTLVELMVVIAIIAILSAIAIPNYINMRAKGFCSEAEMDAEQIASAIANYFGTAKRITLPTVEDLNIGIFNHAEIIGADPNVSITIRVTDRTGRCPLEYQAANQGWDSNYVFIKTIE